MERAIDYDAIRRALVTAVRLSTGLSQQQVVTAQPEVANAPRPPLPFITLGFSEVSNNFGQDYAIPTASTDGDVAQIWAGPRTFAMSFNAFATSHEEADGLLALWLAHLETLDIQEFLRERGIAFYRSDSIMDLTEIYDAGHQPRAYVQVTFGVLSRITLHHPTIEQVQVTGPGTNVFVPHDAPPSGGGGASTITVTCQPTDTVGDFVSVQGDGIVQAADCDDVEWTEE